MKDCNHYFSDDLTMSPTGGIQMVEGVTRSNQRILRRLLTNPGEYIQRPNYGGGIRRYIGAISNIPEITATIKAQLALEPSVAQNPAPVINVLPIDNGVTCNIKYTESESGVATTLSFNVST